MTDVHNEVLMDEDFDTILAADIDFSGVLNFEKPFMIRGKFSGEIDAQGLLVVDEGALVEAAILAPNIIIRGRVTGNVTATVKLEISGTGDLTGNVTTPYISMETGARFNGRCSMPETRPTLE